MTITPKKISHYFELEKPQTKARLDHALSKLLPDYSRTQIQAWIQEGALKVNGACVKPNMKVQGGEKIELDVTLTPKEAWQAEVIDLAIVYEDEHLMVINKPQGLVVHPAPGNRQHTLLNGILHHCPAANLLPRAGILHRLDKHTSGLLVVAKTQPVLKDLQSQLKKRTLLREYKAIVQGRLISGATIDAPIARHPIKRKQMGVIDTGKTAITHYRVIEKFPLHTYIKVKLETGRTHQIRVHMAHIHHPIVGDPTYGGRLRIGKNMHPELITGLRQFKRQALHAYAIGFTHPIDKKWLQFEVDLPEDMALLLHWLKKDIAK